MTYSFFQLNLKHCSSQFKALESRLPSWFNLLISSAIINPTNLTRIWPKFWPTILPEGPSDSNKPNPKTVKSRRQSSSTIQWGRTEFELKVFLEAISIRSKSLFYGQNWIQCSIWLHLRFWIETWKYVRYSFILSNSFQLRILNMYKVKAMKFIHSFN